MKKEGQGKKLDDLSMPEEEFDRMVGQALGSGIAAKTDEESRRERLRQNAQFTKECANLSAMNENDDSFQTMRDSLVAQMVQLGWTEDRAEHQVDRCIKAARLDRESK